jgi:cell wall-associated NlpC family hydrolase
VLGFLATFTVVSTLVAAVTGVVLAVALAVAGLALSAGYLALVTWVRRRAAYRDLTRAFAAARGAGVLGWEELDWADLERELALPEVTAAAAEMAVDPGAGIGAGALLRFVACYLAACALTPFVALLRLVGGDLTDLERHDVLGRVMRFQQSGRTRSLQVLTVSMATATVAVVGSSGAAAFAATPAAYTVKAGDTLGAIAESYGVPVATLAAANGLSDPNLIYPGQVLSLAGTASPTTAATSGSAVSSATVTSYTVQAGDTLSAIAERDATTWPLLAEVNHLANPNLLTVGEVLTLPVTQTAVLTSVTTSTTTSSSTSSPAPAAAAPATAASATAAPATAAEVAVQTAVAQVGKPYLYGGAGPTSYDCSGLVMYAWAAAGIGLPHYSVSQYDDTERISESELQPGDIVFYDNGEGPQPGHEALYIGNGQVVAANTTGTYVQIQSITYDGTPFGFGRVR